MIARAWGAGATLLALALVGCQSTTSGHAASASSHTAASSSSSLASRSSTPTTTLSSASQEPQSTITVQGTTSGTTYLLSLWAHDDLSNCADHSYGQQVITYFEHYPCRAASRYLYTLSIGGRTAAVSIVAVIAAPGTSTNPYAAAAKLVQLEQANGTGSINDLLREGKRFPGSGNAIPPNEVFQVLAQDNGVDVFDAWYVEGATDPNDATLKKLEADLFLSSATTVN